MKKDDLLSGDFLNQFKTGEELQDFLSALQKRGNISNRVKGVPS